MVAVKTDGTMWSWGGNLNGVLGLNQSSDNVKYSSPVQIGTDTNWSKVRGGDGSAAIKTDGTLYTWGYNQYGGMLGHNETGPGATNYSSPVQVPGTYKISTAGGAGVAFNTMIGVKAV